MHHQHVLLYASLYWNSRALQIGTGVLEFLIILLLQSQYRDRNNENLIHDLSLYQSNSIVICFKVTPISFHEKCEISPIDMTSPDDEVITIQAYTSHVKIQWTPGVTNFEGNPQKFVISGVR